MLSYVIRSWFLHAHNLLEQVRYVDLWLELMFDQAKLRLAVYIHKMPREAGLILSLKKS